MSAAPLVAAIVRMYRDEGRSQRDIAAETGVSRQRIRGILIGAGLPPRGAWRRRPVPPVAEIVKRYAAGESIGALATAYRDEWWVIAGILDGAGVPIRSTSEAMKMHHAGRTPEQYETWARAAREGRDRARRERNRK